MKKTLILAFFLLMATPAVRAENTTWKQATNAELASILPARAQVVKEHIETEMRTASGVVNNHGQYIAGVVLITAGYSADGKYSHYLLVQAPIRVEGVELKPGDYILGWLRDGTTIKVHINVATTGALVGNAVAHRLAPHTRVESLKIWPPGDKSLIQIGRFGISYAVEGK